MQAYQKALEAAARAIETAEVLWIGSGAGMGVDSGLPDFRGPEGFWRAYPPYRALRMNFTDAANPDHFLSDPQLAWGFYGHRLNMYRSATPHDGFQILRKWIENYNLEYFVYTSNVDGQFQKAGFPEEKISEIHGSIHYLQCMRPCRRMIWKNDEIIEIDIENMRAERLPACPYCDELSRPNILMFGDWGWISDRSDNQSERYHVFQRQIANKNAVIVEIGAGKSVPSIRYVSERLARNASFLRINTRDSDGAQFGVPLGGLDGLRAIDALLNGSESYARD